LRDDHQPGAEKHEQRRHQGEGDEQPLLSRGQAREGTPGALSAAATSLPPPLFAVRAVPRTRRPLPRRRSLRPGHRNSMSKVYFCRLSGLLVTRPGRTVGKHGYCDEGLDHPVAVLQRVDDALELHVLALMSSCSMSCRTAVAMRVESTPITS
jgi:hypothetical protein